MAKPAKRTLPNHGAMVPRYKVTRKAYIDGFLVGPDELNGDEVSTRSAPSKWMLPVNDAARQAVKNAPALRDEAVASKARRRSMIDEGDSPEEIAEAETVFDDALKAEEDRKKVAAEVEKQRLANPPKQPPGR